MRFDAEKRRIASENKLIIEREDKERAIIQMEQYKQEKEDEIKKRIEDEKQMRISKQEASISQTVAQRIKKERDDLTIKLNEKEKQYKELLDQKEVELKIAAVKVRFKEFQLNKKDQNDKDFERDNKEKNRALQQIETLNSQIDQLNRESVEHEHNLQISLESLDRETSTTLQERERSLQEIERRKKAEEEKGIIKGENEILLGENARLKQLLGEERTNEEIQRVEEEKRIYQEEKTKLEEIVRISEHGKREAEDRARIAEQQKDQSEKEKDDLIKKILDKKDLRKLNLISWTEIANELKKPLGLNQRENESVKQIQEKVCELICEILTGDEKDELRKRAIEAGVAEAIISIFTSRPLYQITKIYIDAFFNFTMGNNENKKILIEKKPYPALIRLLDRSDTNIVNSVIGCIFNLLIVDTNTSFNSQHPHLIMIQECGGIDKIFDLFKRNLSKYSKDASAIIIGYLFKSRTITNQNQRRDVIAHLKTLINDTDQWAKNQSRKVLRYLAQNFINQIEIQKGGFTIPD
ncbi:MAG: hypothetical protein EZS28_016305 [Streblomastix strix]|uniref:Uncharacterized protein n=1 Tax=Streblomastix strix TaxID=222440 RepID=A0A5J4W011_9EUKA|nr:MAG: hypothetical protein EZS28_016305 [Streblomastix strix]